MASVENNFIFKEAINQELVDMNRSIIYESISYIYPKNDTVVIYF
jgi:hypothetical protein